MNKPLRKPRGRPPGKRSEISRLKIYWHTILEPEREAWRQYFYSDATQPVIRGEILKRLNINLTNDMELTNFRKWERKQRKIDEEATQQADDQLRLEAEFGGQWSFEEIRREVLRRSYARTLSQGDFKLALHTMRENIRLDRLILEARRVKLLEKTKSKADAPQKPLNHPELTPEQRAQRIKEIYGRA